jgi:hypothetical protein
MRLTLKLVSILILLLLASPVILLKGCSGKASGGCPDDAAPAGAKIIAPTGLGAPSVPGGGCYPVLPFTVTDSAGDPLNGICVEIFTNGFIALHSGNADCHNVVNDPKTSITTRTDSSGVVSVELVTGPTVSGQTFFVEVASGGTSGVATTAAAQ